MKQAKPMQSPDLTPLRSSPAARQCGAKTRNGSLCVKEQILENDRRIRASARETERIGRNAQILGTSPWSAAQGKPNGERYRAPTVTLA